MRPVIVTPRKLSDGLWLGVGSHNYTSIIIHARLQAAFDIAGNDWLYTYALSGVLAR